MLKHLILTVMSDDKPGIVTTLATTVKDHEGNWLESRLAQLAGKFAGVIRISVESEHHDALISGLQNLKASHIAVTIEESKANSPTNSSSNHLSSAEFSLLGPDRSGIVKELMQAFSSRGINVEELETACSSMPYSGDPLFEASGVVSLPDGEDFDDLAEQLDQIGDKLAMDVSLKRVVKD